MMMPASSSQATADGERARPGSRDARACRRSGAAAAGVWNSAAWGSRSPRDRASGPCTSELEQQHRDIGQHQADEDLVGVEAGAQEAPGSPPRPCRRAMPAMHISGSSQQPVGRIERQRDAAAGERADGVLALGADVPDVGAEADDEADRDQDQRRGLDQQLGEPAQRSSAADEDQPQRLERRSCRGSRTARAPASMVSTTASSGVR